MTYLAPAQLSATSVEADLGALGEVSLTVSPSGVKGPWHTECGKGRAVPYEPPVYSGSFEFHGEEGYTDAVAAAPRDYVRFFASLVCGPFSMEAGDGPGARLRLRGTESGVGLHLQVNENHPGGRARFEVEASEKRGSIRISRESTFWLRSSAFRFDPALKTATLAPAPPFSGHATFRRAAAPAKRHPGVHLAGANFGATCIYGFPRNLPPPLALRGGDPRPLSTLSGYAGQSRPGPLGRG